MSKLSGHTCGYFYAILFQDNLNVQKKSVVFLLLYSFTVFPCFAFFASPDYA